MGSMLGLPEYMRTLSSYDHILSALGCLCVRDRSRVRMAIDVHGCTEFRFSSCSSLRYVLARRGQTGPHDLLALGASHPHIAVAADVITGVTWGFLSFLGGVSYRIRILMYFDVSCMYPDRILMCPVHIHQDTSRYIKIHQDTFVSVTLAIIGNVSYLGICILLYDTFRIHLRYI
jgi:hypothetical protein